MHTLRIVIAVMLSALPAAAASAADETVVYKTIGDVKLAMNIYRPPGWQAGEKRSAILFFFGGGWTRGSAEQEEPRAKHFAALGMVAICADYRVKDRHGTTPFEAIDDGRSAIEYVAAHATELGLDPRRIVAAGSSSGGHIAASLSTLPPVKVMPAALVLFNPAVDTPRNPAVAGTLAGRELEISPLRHVKQGMPPAILFHGTADEKVPIADAEAFCTALRKVGSRCELVRYDGANHGFAGYGRGPGYADTNTKAEVFLRSLRLMH
jgi:acetyl esterase/lipase